MVRFMHLIEINVVGTAGFHFQCRVRKTDGTLDSSLNQRVEAAWAKWCKMPTCDGKMTMVDFLVQMATTYKRDGEYIFEFVSDPRFPDGLALNPVEADMLDEQLNVSFLPNGNQIRMGVEVDQYGAPVAYHMLEIHPGDSSWSRRSTTNRWRRVPAERIVHIYQRRRPGQTRGHPPSTIVNPIKMLDGYRDAEVTGRRVNAAQGGWIETEAGASPAIDALSDAGNEVEGDDESDLIMTMEPGVIRALKPGQKYSPSNPNGMISDYKQFEGQIKKDIASGMGISVMSHGMETEGISYSSGRTVVIEDRNFYKQVQQFLIDNGMEPIFTRWLDAHALSDTASFPPSRREAIIDGHSFRGRGWDWVDPSKDVKANSEALRTRQMSLSQVAAQRGIDIRDLLAEIAADEAMLNEFGLTLTTDVKNAAAKPA
jgi:lambda family phage portal protein